MVTLLLRGVNRALDLAAILRGAAPDAYPRDRVDDAIAAVVHRALFGRLPGLDAGDGTGPRHRVPTLRMSGALGGLFERVRELEAEAGRPDRRALASMLEVGDAVVVGRGYEGARVDDVIAAAGVSHGAFYRYFPNIDEFVRIVAVRAVADISAVLAEVPGDGSRPALRRWLRQYHAVHVEHGALIRIWVEAVEEAMKDDRAAVFDWGRRRMVPVLDGRGFGDVDVEALVLLAMVEAFGADDSGAVDLDAALRVIERGFLGRTAGPSAQLPT
jgi:AcrR family transcriptional regulator